jgi:hypothetical protein
MIAHVDCSTGVSGDKLLGALLDAGERMAAQGVPLFQLATLQDAARRVAPEAVVHTERVTRGGLSALGVRVEAMEPPPHRRWREVRSLIASAALPENAVARALRVFERIAEAEGAVHDIDPEEVHFHEVGALDSIIDIVGVCLGLELLGIERLVCSTVAVGSGSVSCSHGILPVPTPATAHLLAGIPIEAGPAVGELTTPTGAALIREAATSFGPLPHMTPVVTGSGAGTRSLDGVANILRIIVGDDPVTAPETERVVLLETNLDHLSPEALAFAAEEIRADGALDVWCTPVLMKKQRPGVLLSVLATVQDADRLGGRIHELTGSLGVRRNTLVRSVAPRECVTLPTPFGPVRFKRGAGRTRPEHDEVARISRETGRRYDEVLRELEAAGHENRGQADERAY